MPLVTIVVGVLLVVLGVVSHQSSPLHEGHHAGTALIPAYVGGALVLLGAIALNPRALKHAMHLAVIVGLVGFLASVGRLGSSLAQGRTPTRLAGTSLGLMALLTGVFVALCVRSFVVIRRNRRAAAPGLTPGPGSDRI